MKAPTEWPQKVKSGNTTIPIYRSKTRGYEEFKVVWYDADRKRRFKTFADFEDARKHAQNVNAAICSGEINTVTLTNDDRLIYLRAKNSLSEMGVPLDTAAAEYADARRELKGVALLDAVPFPPFFGPSLVESVLPFDLLLTCSHLLDSRISSNSGCPVNGSRSLLLSDPPNCVQIFRGKGCFQLSSLQLLEPFVKCARLGKWKLRS
jgi:hypothetical protein